jgi:hypothetical protein
MLVPILQSLSLVGSNSHPLLELLPGDLCVPCDPVSRYCSLRWVTDQLLHHIIASNMAETLHESTRHEVYDAQQALLSIRMISVSHQAVNQELGTLLRDRFREALIASGYEGDIRYRTGVQHIFREPERPAPRSTPPRKLRHLPHRIGCRGEAGRRRQPAAAESHEGARAGVGSGTAGPSGRVAQSDGEDIYTPDTGLYYVPPGNMPDYFPGLFLEVVGWSHQLPDSRAKRELRPSPTALPSHVTRTRLMVRLSHRHD